MARFFAPLAFVALVLFAAAPVVIAYTPFEQTMGLVQKIFYFHVPSAMMMFVSAFVCGISSAIFLFRKTPTADRLALAAGELVVAFGLIVMTTGPLWGRKAWGVWWQWDAKLTSALLLWMIFIAYLLVRARSRDVLLPVLLYPITIPVIIAGVRGTAALFQATPDEPMARFWAALLIFFDVVFVTLSLWTFEPLMTE